MRQARYHIFPNYSYILDCLVSVGHVILEECANFVRACPYTRHHCLFQQTMLTEKVISMYEFNGGTFQGYIGLFLEEEEASWLREIMKNFSSEAKKIGMLYVCTSCVLLSAQYSVCVRVCVCLCV